MAKTGLVALAESSSSYARQHGDVVKRVADLGQTISALILLHSKTHDSELAKAFDHLQRQKPASRRYLTIEEFLDTHGAPRDRVKDVFAYALAGGFDIATHGGGLAIELIGTLDQFEKSFGVQFDEVQRGDTTFLTFRNEPAVPKEIAECIEAILGLETMPASSHRMAAKKRTAQENSTGMEATEVARRYLFPETIDLSGQCIGLLELGGGFHESDLYTYCKERKLLHPKVKIASGHNNPASAETIADYISGKVDDIQARWTVEVTLDVELACTFAPGARVAVYFAPDSDKGQYEALLLALTDKLNRPSVLSISFGGPETSLNKRWVHAIDRWLKAAALMGVTVCVASGDLIFDLTAEAYIPPGHDPKVVSFPGSSPHVLSCGGSHLLKGEPETVWNEEFRGFRCSTIGGVSEICEEPMWQRAADVSKKVAGKTGRGVPDVAGKADLAGGYSLIAGGKEISMGGTSASAPMWAALIASLNAHLETRLGFVTPLFYTEALNSATHQINHGGNGVWKAGPGWNPCTGMGSPKGTHMLKALQEIYPKTLKAG